MKHPGAGEATRRPFVVWPALLPGSPASGRLAAAMDLLTEHESLLRALESGRVRYALAGGLALRRPEPGNLAADSKGVRRDPEAVRSRLRQVAQLRRLGRLLQRAGGSAEPT